jgi:Putative zinc-finger
MATRKTASASTNKSCKEITDLIFGYLNDRLSPAVKRDFERHLRICPDCVNFLNTYKKTADVTRSISPEEIPPGIRENILDFLRGRMRKSGTSSRRSPQSSALLIFAAFPPPLTSLKPLSPPLHLTCSR